MSDLIDKDNTEGCVYSDTEIQLKLSTDLPHWFYEDGWIRRKYKTSGWKATLMVVNTVGHLAEAAWHHPDLTVSYAFVVVKLCTHSAKGITDKDFELATKIESVVSWRPSQEASVQGKVSALEGTPNDDARFKYIKYDD
jgi:4a-hydroxytetrahydrobiopterin dehydratase